MQSLCQQNCLSAIKFLPGLTSYFYLTPPLVSRGLKLATPLQLAGELQFLPSNDNFDMRIVRRWDCCIAKCASGVQSLLNLCPLNGSNFRLISIIILVIFELIC